MIISDLFSISLITLVGRAQDSLSKDCVLDSQTNFLFSFSSFFIILYKILYKVLMKRLFHVLTINHVLDCVPPGDWSISINLWTSHFPIIPRQRK